MIISNTITNIILSYQLPCTTLAILFFFFLYRYSKHNEILYNLPLFGMFPEFVLSFHQIHDKVAQILEKSNGTFLVKGAWLGQMDTLVTCDPANVYCVMSEKFSRYEKGPGWRKRFDFVGDQCAFNTDFEEWQHYRKFFRFFLCHPLFYRLSTKTIPDIIENGLIPALLHFSQQQITVDLQDLFKRYVFDFATVVVTGSNSNSLTGIGLPRIPFSRALDDACEAAALRHLVPERIWKLQCWLGIGKERKLRDARRTIEQFCAEQISKKQQELSKAVTTTELDEESFSFLNCFFSGHQVTGPIPTEKVMRDNIKNMYIALGETISSALPWFFWLISKNPFAEIRIREELRSISPVKEVENFQLFDMGDLSKLVYLHAALCETLRLFPSVPIQFRTPMQAETLASGHKVNQKTNIVISTYAMGRMASIWGKDCREFKPERWITEEGNIKHKPPHKFFAFNAGPRICLGKDLSFMVMKAITAAIIHNYNVKVLESQPVIPKFSIFLSMKQGLMAKITKISA